jgi:uncharacterized protein (TIGR03435 family)
MSRPGVRILIANVSKFLRWSLLLFPTLLLFSTITREEQKIAPRVGDVPPPIQFGSLLQAPEGARIDWESLKGKVVVLEFWATSCGPCVGAISHWNELADAFEKRGVVFVSITDEDQATIDEFLKKKPIHGWIGLDSTRTASKSFGVDQIPYTLIVGTNGKIAAITYPTILKSIHLEKVLRGEESGLPNTARSDHSKFITAGTIPNVAMKDQLATCQIVIRHSTDDVRGGMAGSAGKNEFGRVFGYTKMGATVDEILLDACDVTPAYLVIDSPLPPGKFDVFIKIPYSGYEQWKTLYPRVVEATFGLKLVHSHRELDSYVLTVKSDSPKTLQPTATPQTQYSNLGAGNFEAVNTSVGTLKRGIETYLDKPVFDETRLSGGYDFKMTWNGTNESHNPAGLIDALRSQLGLELTTVKRSVDLVVVTPGSKPVK